MPAVDFHEFSKNVVAKFLQTVVVLDDGAFMEPVEEAIGDIIEPDQGAPILEEEAAPPRVESPKVDAPPAQPRSVNSLDAKLLIDGFAERGQVCAVLLPWSANDESGPTLAASRRADILVLDWQLGDEGEKAIEIMKRLLASDEAEGGRLRMIAVYTASPDIEAIRDRVAGEMHGFSRVDNLAGLGIALTSRQARIVFLRKGRSDHAAGSVSEQHLASRLIDEYVELAGGLLANVALGAISAIRDETHNVLARLHNGLDGPFLTHRLLLVTPDDAEGYVVDLLVSEFQSLLQSRGLGRTHAGRDIIEGALIKLEQSGRSFRLMTAKNEDKKTVEVSRDNLMSLVDTGPAGLETIENVKISQSKLHERVYVLFDNDLQSGLDKHREFARASALVREVGNCASDWVARMSLGTIVRRGEQYLICIQPVCDAVRLKAATQFIFAELKVSPDKFDVVVGSADASSVCLSLNDQASMIRTAVFEPDETTYTVQAQNGDGVRVFFDSGGADYIWVADLKTSLAQRIVHRIATNLSRIGLDEYEWQRRHS